MCGIAGFCGDGTRDWLDLSCRLLKHRGPDGEGVYLDPRGGAGLAHRRLSILDLSDAGKQPMASADGRYWISYNGELYNFRELRQRLETAGRRFRSHSDTEVILAAWQEWGPKILNEFNGIFAFALWDAEERSMTLVRDPLGVKPLHWAQNAEGTLYFASEIGVLRKAKGVSSELDAQALESYLSLLWVPGPKTLFESVHQLEPGHLLTFKTGQAPVKSLFTDLYRSILEPPADPGPSAEDLWKTLQRSVERQLVSDVPVGAFLSGGLDSTGIIAACPDKSALTAYTIAFSQKDSQFEAASNDLQYSKEVSRLYGIKHEVLHVDPDITQLLPTYLRAMDQPVGDHAPLASYLICQAASPRAKVLLSGQGADEIFGGYPWHKAGLFSAPYNLLPRGLRRQVLEPLIERLPGGKGGRWLGNLRRLKRFGKNASAAWPERYADFCRYLNLSERKELLQNPQTLGYPELVYLKELQASAALSPTHQMLYTDLMTFLPGLNLFYTDRTSMAHGVEVRVPYLDLEMVRMAFQIPDRRKLSYFSSKTILKESLRSRIPANVISRKKAGFGLPVRSWMRTALAPMMKEHLSESNVKKRGLFNPKAIQRLIQEQETGREDRAYLLFSLLVLELWMQIHIDLNAPSLHERAALPVA